MLKSVKKFLPDTHPLRLLYHRIKASIAAVYYGFPGNKMVVIGVTGTNGKTTTVNLIANILSKTGEKVGMTSTIGFRIADQKWVNDTKQSTASPFALQRLLKRMVKAGCKYAVVEVTSHAVTQSRILGINFDVAVLTNISEDHLEYHGSFNNYLSAKGGLFKKVSKGKRKFSIPKIIVLNADDEQFSYFDRFVADRKVSYGMKSATVYSEQVKTSPEGSEFILHVPNNAVPVSLTLPGDYNIYNALAAASVCMSLGVSVADIAEGLKLSTSVAGRFEHVEAGQDYSVIVDYAHTTDALDNLLSLYRKLTPGRLIAVFGATGGGRDKMKRPKMGAVANEYADMIILTNDDPYDEDQLQIIDQVAEGVGREEGRNFWMIPDRREALRLALTMARKGDTVIAAGKGAEEVMIIDGKRVPWNDKVVIEELIKREVVVEISDDEWVKRPNVCLES